MSISVMNLVWKTAPYSGGTLLTLLALADWSNEEGVCFPKIATLAKKARLSERAAQSAIKNLVEDGALSIESESDRPGQPRVFKIGVQYLHPSEGDGCSLKQKGVQFATEKGCSLRQRNKEEPSVEPPIEPLTLDSQSSSGSKKKPDPRHSLFKERIFACYRYLNEGENPPWDGSDAKQLALIIRAKPDLTLEKFNHWLKNYAKSENINPADRPRAFLPRIERYSKDRLNQYGKPFNRSSSESYVELTDPTATPEIIAKEQEEQRQWELAQQAKLKAVQ